MSVRDCIEENGTVAFQNSTELSMALLEVCLGSAFVLFDKKLFSAEAKYLH